MENYFDSFVNEYADEIVAIQPEFYKNTAKFINDALSNLKKDCKVLDIGNGGVINYNFSGIEKLICADLSVSEKAVKRYADFANVEFCNADMLNLSQFKDNTFDAVIVQTVIHHLAGSTFRQTEENVAKGLGECFRVLNGGGVLLIVESVVVPWFERLERIFYAFMQLFFKIIHFDTVYQYSAKSLLRKISNLGFHIEQEEEIKLDKYIWLCRKKVLTGITPCRAHWILIRK